MSQADNAAAISWAATLDTNWVCEVYDNSGEIQNTRLKAN